SGAIAVVGEVPSRGQLAIGTGHVYGNDEHNQLWSFDVAAKKLNRSAISLPPGDWSGPLRWARDSSSGLLFTADSRGVLYRFDEKRFRELGKAHLSPIGPMAVTADGRLFGFCGEDMANLFVGDPTSGTVKNLGVAASVLEKRRYGYQFGDAVTGR